MKPRSVAKRLAELVPRFEQKRLLVVGDSILDRYVWGSVERISPEAPVPVVRTLRESTMLGGAGNVARNAVSLGASVEFVSLVGDDEVGREVVRLLADWKISARGVTVDPQRPTTVKTRVIARSQQVVRFDRESDEPISEEVASRLLEAARNASREVDGVVIQDYGKGLLTAEIITELMSLFNERELRVFVDPKEQHWERYGGAELLKPNLREAQIAAGIRLRDEADVERIGRALLERIAVGTLAITRGGEGITLIPADGALVHVPTATRAVAEASGAGDTAIAILALARLSGASWIEAAELANAGAGVVVSVPGTAAVTPAELLAAIGVRR